MKLIKSLPIFIFLLGFVLQVSAQVINDKKFKVSTKDKLEILKQVFEDGFDELIKDEKFLPCSIPIVKERKILLIETDEPSIFLKEIGDYKFRFMNSKQIEAEVKSNNGDCYFQINPIRFNNSKEANIILWRWIKVVTVVDGKSWYPSRWVYASGRVYKATKEKGKWQVKYLHGTAVVS